MSETYFKSCKKEHNRIPLNKCSLGEQKSMEARFQLLLLFYQTILIFFIELWDKNSQLRAGGGGGGGGGGC